VFYIIKSIVAILLYSRGQRNVLFIYPEYGGDLFLRNICLLLTDYTALYPRGQNSSSRGEVIRIWVPLTVSSDEFLIYFSMPRHPHSKSSPTDSTFHATQPQQRKHRPWVLKEPMRSSLEDGICRRFILRSSMYISTPVHSKRRDVWIIYIIYKVYARIIRIRNWTPVEIEGAEGLIFGSEILLFAMKNWLGEKSVSLKWI
jgi:hypothetical protein